GAVDHELAGVRDDAVFDENFGRSVRKTDCITGPARLRPRTGMDVRITDLDAERVVDRKTLAQPLRVFDILGPAVGSVFKANLSVRTTLHGQAFDARILHVNAVPAGLTSCSGVARELGAVAGSVTDMER